MRFYSSVWFFSQWNHTYQKVHYIDFFYLLMLMRNCNNINSSQIFITQMTLLILTVFMLWDMVVQARDDTGQNMIVYFFNIFLFSVKLHDQKFGTQNSFKSFHLRNHCPNTHMDGKNLQRNYFGPIAIMLEIIILAKVHHKLSWILVIWHHFPGICLKLN